MKQIKIAIPEPCHENWDVMQKADRGRFCLSCQKQVVDFSTMTDQAILQYMQQASGTTCGRFAPDQLQQPIAAPQPAANRFWAKLVFQLLFPAFVFTQRTKAQMGIVAFKEELPVAAAPHNKPIPHQLIAELKGKITDSLSGEAIVSASIQIKGASIGALSDNNGDFILPVGLQRKAFTVIISATGYKARELNIKDASTAFHIQLSPYVKEMANVVLLAYPPNRKLTNITMGATMITSECIVKKRPIIKRIADTLTGNNNISLYPNPVNRGNAIQIDMKKVQMGQYVLRLFSISGSLVQQQPISVPAKDFNFQWPLNSQIAAGNYVVHISNAAGKLIYTDKIVVM